MVKSDQNRLSYSPDNIQQIKWQSIWNLKHTDIKTSRASINLMNHYKTLKKREKAYKTNIIFIYEKKKHIKHNLKANKSHCDRTKLLDYYNHNENILQLYDYMIYK